MKTNELMIGDLVYYSHTEDGIAPYKEVICIKAEDLCRDACIIETHYEPIPLTPKILEKNGFKEEQLPIGVRKMIWESEDTRTEIVLYMDDTMPMEIRKNIYYEDEICYTLPFVWAVHQLQHLIRLCDINKTIEL